MFEHGTFYFLNYASSYIQWKQNGDQAAPLDFIHPFGRSRHVYVQTDDGSDVEEEDKEWEPTEAFPVFEMDADDALPKQDDKHSCGLAVVVGCSTMTRAIYDESFSSSPLYEVFLTKNMKLFGNTPPKPKSWERPRHRTWKPCPHCFLPHSLFKRARNKDISLPKLREEMLVLTDELANIIHEKIQGEGGENTQFHGIYKDVTIHLYNSGMLLHWETSNQVTKSIHL